MATTQATTGPAQSTGSLLLTVAQIALSTLAGLVTGGLSADISVAAGLAGLLSTAVSNVIKPTLSSIGNIVQEALTLLEGITNKTVAADATVGAAVLQIVQAAAAAVTAQAGLPIDPTLVPPETPIPTSGTASSGTGS